ncbi:NAD-dependent epimerase/dehydratase family protein [Pseudomonas mangiferae]|nr:NAD-dependent epimerase/dehydratase family protein [Pseudomonas mangiferae]
MASSPSILLCGASGFIGGAVLRALWRHDVQPRLLLRRLPDDAGGAAFAVRGDLTDADSLRGCCEGIDTLIHCASAVAADDATCQAVNVEGTQRLLDEAQRAGVSRVIYLSTAAVYGDGVHRQLREDQQEPAPVSVTSRTRREAERRVLAAGGTVLRPFLVYGAGDRWFLPALVGLLRRHPVTVEGGEARLSLLAVEDLAESIVALALTPQAADRGRVYHVAPARPATQAEVIQALHAQGLVPAPTADLSHAQAAEATRTLGAGVARQLALIAFEHTYDGQALRERTGITPRPFAEGFAACAGAYAQALQVA